MPTLTATLVTATGPVRLDIDASDVGAPYVYVARVDNATGAITPVRTHGTTGSNGDGLAYQGIQAGFKGVMYDTEFPYGTTFHYTLTSPAWGVLANVDFSTTSEPWTPTNATLSNGSNISLLPTAANALVIHPAGAVPASAASELFLAAPGVEYAINATALPALSVNDTAQLSISWYNASQVLISTSTQPAQPMTTGLPLALTYLATAPALTRYAKVTLGIPSNPGTSTVTYWYNLTVSNWPAGTSTASSANLSPTAPVTPTWFLRDPLRPANDVTIQLCWDANNCVPAQGILFVGITQRAYPSNSSRFNIAGQPQTQTISRVRGALQGTLTLVTRTAADEAALLTLLAAGTPLLFQSPPAWNLPDMYLSIDTEGVTPLSPDQSYSLRAYQLPFAAELAPGGPAYGVPGARWADVCDWTWASANAGGKTWQNLMDGGM